MNCFNLLIFSNVVLENFRPSSTDELAHKSDIKSPIIIVLFKLALIGYSSKSYNSFKLLSNIPIDIASSISLPKYEILSEILTTQASQVYGEY